MIQSVLSWSNNENDGVIKDMRNTGVLTYLKSTLVNLFFNTLNQLVLWISSDGAEQQTVRNGNHKSGKVKLTTTSMKAITKGETGMCVGVGVGGWLGADGREEKKARVKKETLNNT